MATEKSFQIKSLYPDHKCCRNYVLGSLVTYKWIAHHYAKEIIENPYLTHRYMQNAIKEKFLISVSLGQCQRAKTCALYDHEGGLIDHYSKLWDYRQAVLESNPGSTCHLETEEKKDGRNYFKRIYMCFKGVKQGWLDACRKVIGLDGCFLSHTCKGQLLTAIGRDANNQMYPIAWAVVAVENKDNWAWFLSLLSEDLELGYGNGITVISDGHKGLIEAVAGIIPDAEHRQCARHIYANFKKTWSGLHYKRLFWGAASCTVDRQFVYVMDKIKDLDPAAYKCLVERNPDSWCRAFFEMDRCSAAFENGISESFNSKIVLARGKPIITMLENIRIYVMQRMCEMNKLSFKLEDSVKPSVRKRLELLKKHLREWLVYQSGFKEVEVRRGDVAYGVNLHTKMCGCRFWELSGIPCVHAMEAYCHMKLEPEVGVNNYLSKQSWYNAYQYSIRPVHGSSLWTSCDKPAPYPPIERKKPGRPRKQRIRHPTENLDDHHVTRVGRVMHCHNCWEVGHNKKGCQNGPRHKPTGLDTNEKDPSQTPSTGVKRGNTKVQFGSVKKRGTIRIGSPIRRGEDDDVNLTAEEYQHKMDMEALKEVEKEMQAEEAEQEKIRKIWAENEANDLYWENQAKEFQDHEVFGSRQDEDDAYSFESNPHVREDELNVHQVTMDLPVTEAPENCTTDESQVQAQVHDPNPVISTQGTQVQTRSKIRKQVAATTSMRIYHKMRGRSERIAKMKSKNFKFDEYGTGSTPDKAFIVSEDED